MISATQLRPGMVIKFNNELYSVFSMNHRTPGNLRGFVQAKMRNLRSGSMTEHRFSSEDKVEKAILEEQEMEYLYDDGEYYYFMNTENYEQMHLMKDLLGDAVELPDSAVEGDGRVLRRQADQRGTAGHCGHDRGGDRARPEGRHRFQRHQAGQDWKPAWWCRCPRSSPKAKRSASTRPKARTRNARRRCFRQPRCSEQLFLVRETPFAIQAPGARLRSAR